MKTSQFHNAIVPVLIVFFFLSCLAGLGAELDPGLEYRIRKVKLAGASLADSAMVLDAAIELREGSVIKADVLAAAAMRIEDRLLATGYFSLVQVQTVESSSEPGSINVIIEIEDGFLLRFGGGPIYGAVDILNLGGRGQDLGLRLGMNIQDMRYLVRFPGLSGTSVEVQAGRIEEQWQSFSGESFFYQRLGGTFSVQKDLGWGWHLGGSLGGNQVFSQDWVPDMFWLEPALGIRWEWMDRRGFWGSFSPRQGLDLRVKTSARIVLGLPEPAILVPEAELRTYLSVPLGDSTLALRMRGAGQVLGASSDPIHGLRASGSDRVRVSDSGDSLGNAISLANVEFRTRILSMPFMDFSRLGLESFIFLDGALVQQREKAGLANIAGAGLGLRFFFGPPIHVPATLALSFDKEGQAHVFFHTDYSF